MLDPDYQKKGYFWGSKVPSLKLNVEKAGRVLDRKPELKDKMYIKSYIYPNIGLTGKLDDGR